MRRLQNKKGQEILGLSYGAIFSIIIIAFIIAVAFFTIKHFMGLNQCTQVGFFYENLQSEVQRAWTSGRYEGVYLAKLPRSGILRSGVENVCFGNLNSTNRGGFSGVIFNELKRQASNPNSPNNVFIYPPESACGGDEKMYSYHLKCGQSECLTTNNYFFCKNVSSEGVVEIHLSKSTTESVVTVKEN